ncbi:MAG: hypothetical protein QM756_05185 [Polyangiaceae bacterium]
MSAGLGLVGTGVGLYFLSSAKSHSDRGDDLFQSCDPTASCTDGQRAYIHQQDDLAKTDRKRALFTMVPSGALLVTGVALMVVHFSSSGATSAEAPRTTLVGGPNWLGVSTRF